jgi:GMP synthase (glutamine-hydrolysing)
MEREKVIVIDFGGQYNQLVARRVRECNVYCEIYSFRTPPEQIKEMNPKGIILTGGPNSCYEEGAPTYSRELFQLGIPVLGLCYGAQLMMHLLGGKVEHAPVREYGKTEVFVDTASLMFSNISEKTICWMSHFDYIAKEAPGFEITAHTVDCPVAAAENKAENLYFILKFCTRRKARRCCVILCGIYAAAKGAGAWILLWRNQFRRYVKK